MMLMCASDEGEVTMAALPIPANFEVAVMALGRLGVVMDSRLIDVETDALRRGLPHHCVLGEARLRLGMGYPHGPTASSEPLNGSAVQFPSRLSTL